MVDIPWGNHNDIFSHVIGVVVLLNHLPADGLHVANIPKNGQAYLLVLEYSPMRDFDGGLQGLGFASLKKLPMDGGSLILNILFSI